METLVVGSSPIALPIKSCMEGVAQWQSKKNILVTTCPFKMSCLVQNKEEIPGGKDLLQLDGWANINNFEEFLSR